jgi:hypothetical protein
MQHVRVRATRSASAQTRALLDEREHLEGGEGRKLARFAGDLEQGQQHAREHVRTATDAVRGAIAYDGYLTLEGDRTDAIFVEADERGRGHALVFAQR